MEYRQLGQTGLNVSTIGLGCEGFIGKTAEETRQLMDFAIGNGINFMDLYSPNPDLRQHIGSALQGRRADFHLQGHLCTTWKNNQYLRTRLMKEVRPAFEEQLKELHTDYLDVGMIHYIDQIKDFDKVFRGPIIEFAQKLKREGKIRSIGISSHNPEVAIRAVKDRRIDVLMFSINPCYDMQPATEEVEDLWAEKNYAHPLLGIDPLREQLYTLCEQTGIGIDVMKVYGGGDLLSRVNSPFGRAFTPVQCMDYALSRPAVAAVMVGCRNMDEIKHALAWINAENEEKDYTKALQGIGQFSWKGHCMYCGHCAPCTAGIDIATVNKLYNLTIAENEIPETVREHYKALSHHASECIQCGKCETRCPFGVEIRRSIKNAANKFGI